MKRSICWEGVRAGRVFGRGWVEGVRRLDMFGWMVLVEELPAAFVDGDEDGCVGEVGLGLGEMINGLGGGSGRGLVEMLPESNVTKSQGKR